MTELNQPTAFTAVLDSIDSIRVREEIVLTAIPAPSSLAPFGYALAADVRPTAHAEDSEWGTGRIVILHDPSEPDEWGGAWRIVCFAQGPLEPEIGVEQYVADIAWAWLIDALDARGALFHAASGTATKILSKGYGTLAEQGEGAQLELRASWTPVGPDIAAHVEAWAELLALLAGMPPGTESVSLLDARRRS